MFLPIPSQITPPQVTVRYTLLSIIAILSGESNSFFCVSKEAQERGNTNLIRIGNTDKELDPIVVFEEKFACEQFVEETSQSPHITLLSTTRFLSPIVCIQVLLIRISWTHIQSSNVG
jgi:hypothetical protein